MAKSNNLKRPKKKPKQKKPKCKGCTDTTCPQCHDILSTSKFWDQVLEGNI